MDKKVTFSVRSQLASFPAFVLVLQVLGSFLSPGAKGRHLHLLVQLLPTREQSKRHALIKTDIWSQDRGEGKEII